jgi:murein DD-endopeptidase MepM/ murein hydrolase activator NlpD
MPLAPFEIHLHPFDGRARTRRLRVSVRAQRLAWSLAGLAAVQMVAGFAAAPPVVASLLRGREYDLQVARRSQLGERLQSLVARLERLQRSGSELDRRIERIQTIYGLGPEASPRPVRRAPRGAPPETIYASTIVHGNRLEAALEADLATIAERLIRIAEHERRHPELVRTLPVGSPIAGEGFVRTSGFGPRRSPYTRELELHTGLDLAAPVGTPVRAAAAGVVTFAGTIEANRRSDWWRLGRMVVVRHGDAFLTLYGHCATLAVRDGARVSAGQTLATVGDSGWTLAPALHYEVRRRSAEGDWEPVDPVAYLFDLPDPSGEPPGERQRLEATGLAARGADLPDTFLR